MKSPITGKEMKRMVKEEELVFRKETFTILFNYYFCEESNEIFTDEALDTINTNQAYNQYRAKYNLPFPDEIREIREQYDLSAAKMADIFGFGTNVYRHYESGEVPSISNARLIQLSKDPAEFRKLIFASNALKGNVLEQVLQKINILLSDQANFNLSYLPNYLMTGMSNGRASIYTGYKTPSLKKFIEMVVYFVTHIKPWKTKLNKLLFYTDFFHYKQFGYSITGAEYMAIQMGPVPKNFSSIFEYASTNEIINVAFTEFPNGGIGEQFSANHQHAFDSTVFSPEELTTLEMVLKKFKNVSTSDIIKISHEETAWLDNNHKKGEISYDYSFRLVHL
ncbi:putative zinc finger/helix-turn-helix YgiT family protein [Chitinophaga niastensis]|uniref:Putative zinc finger/helix-turn-helix YgiT family protein n=1 Tax=Chitinophaga niastensis TaxID=536980 RepID=A0A2P8HR77_CHINA|nr:type II TA system antitoxin MqsA family protein [Chitinophaga niastensis]PSL48694.1 putative zinc finger/helix-turn-helix YgiT family protein [Chitinophaga niastensis]